MSRFSPSGQHLRNRELDVAFGWFRDFSRCEQSAGCGLCLEMVSGGRVLVWLACKSVSSPVVVVASIVVVIVVVSATVVVDVSIMVGTEGVPNSTAIAFTSSVDSSVVRFASFNCCNMGGIVLYIYVYKETGRTISRAKQSNWFDNLYKLFCYICDIFSFGYRYKYVDRCVDDVQTALPIRILHYVCVCVRV